MEQAIEKVQASLLSEDLRHVREWLQDNPGVGLSADDVPGASVDELAVLATLGRLAGALLRRILASATPDGPGWTTLHDLEAEVSRRAGHEERIVRWLDGAQCPEPTLAVLSAAERLLAGDAEDALATLYSDIVSPRRRRRLGTFFTPKFEVDRMVASWQAMSTSPATVVDIGAGVGIYTVSSASAWPDSSVYAVDVNPVTLGLLVLRLASRPPAGSDTPSGPTRVPDATSPSERVEATDHSGLAPSAGVDVVLDDYVAWAQRTLPLLPGPRLVIGNPPYTRMQLLPRSLRAGLVEELSDFLGRRASLATLMTAVSVKLLADEDGLCLLLPAQWLESDYAKGLREWLWRARSRQVELRLFSSDLFKDATVDAVSLVVGPAGRDDKPVTFLSGDLVETRHEIARSGLCPPEWRSLFAEAGPEAGQTRLGVEPTTTATGVHGELPVSSSRRVASSRSRLSDAPARPLSDYASITRGVATGANWFFVLDEATRQRHGIGYEYLRPLVRRLRAPGAVRARSAGLSDSLLGTVAPALTVGSGQSRPGHGRLDTADTADTADPADTAAEIGWLLVTGRNPTDSAVLDYLDLGEQEGAADPLLCKRRPLWHDLTPELRKFDVALSPMSKGTFRFLATTRNASILNNLYGLRWRDEVSDEERAQVLAFLRSATGQSTIGRAARRQANSLLKIEPKALNQISVSL